MKTKTNQTTFSFWQLKLKQIKPHLFIPCNKVYTIDLAELNRQIVGKPLKEINFFHEQKYFMIQIDNGGRVIFLSHLNNGWKLLKRSKRNVN